MYVKAFVALGDHEYEVGAEVDYDPGDNYQGPSFDVGEPEISAPDCRLNVSRLVDESTLPDGWSDLVEEALVAAHEGAVSDSDEARADYMYDMAREDY